MKNLEQALIVLVLVEHLYFLVLEMFLWQKPKGLRVFQMTSEFAKSTAVMAANQGLYNGFLAMGLAWGLWFSPVEFSHSIFIFFLSCIFIAGIYGGYSVNRRIFFLQGVPACLALVLEFCSGVL